MRQKGSSNPPRPVSRVWRPDLTRLPALHPSRRLFRSLVRCLARLLLGALTVVLIRGRENLPPGPALFVMNHLGDADTALVLATLPVPPETIAKVELLFEFPLLGRLMDWYGVIWIHRGRVDRRALECAIRALREGRSLVITPEGRYSLSGALERGGRGAAFVAMHAGVPVVPMALIGTANREVLPALRALRRPRVTLSIGPAFHLGSQVADGRALRDATGRIMQSVAQLLPDGQRGAYGRRT